MWGSEIKTELSVWIMIAGLKNRPNANTAKQEGRYWNAEDNKKKKNARDGKLIYFMQYMYSQYSLV